MAHKHSVYDSDTHFSINPITRALKNEASTKTSVIQYDHNSERFTFEIPRMVEGHDMSLCNVIQIHYINIDSQTKASNAGVYEVDDMQISPDSDDVIILSWLISQNATQLVGSLNFLIRFACVTDGTVDYVWNTAIYSGVSVSTGIFNGDVIVEEYADVLEQWRQELIASGGVIIDATLTKSGQAADSAVVGQNFDAINAKFADLPSGGSGLTGTEKTALLTLFKAAAYTSDVSATITNLDTLWSGSGEDTGGDTGGDSGEDTGGDSGGDSGGDTGGDSGGDTETTYTVTNNLTNVTNSNAETSVEAGGSYNATLTVADGCELASLTITMGGEDVTDAVYGEGYILITDVTGDIVITAAAAVPEYVDMATGIGTDTVKLYSDSGSTALATKYYQTGAYSLNRTETDAVVKVRLTNNTDSAISSSDVYIGSTNAQAIRNPNSSINVHYAISGSKGSVAAGASVEVEYTVRAGYWLYVCGYGSLDVSVVGALDVHEPTDVLATTSKAIDTFSVYSDAGTTLVEKGTYRTAYATTEAFDIDTLIRLTVVSAGASTGNILYGCVESGTLTANVSAYYGDSAVVKNFATGAALIIDYTVKAGYYFAVLPSKDATCCIEIV